MNLKNIIIGGFVGGVIVFITLFGFNAVVGILAPYDIASMGGMRAIDDPIMLLFFLYPFVLAFAAATVFDVVKDSLKGTQVEKGILYGILLFTVVTIPGIFIMFSSMDYPLGFYVSNFIEGLIGYPLTGILFARIWGL